MFVSSPTERRSTEPVAQVDGLDGLQGSRQSCRTGVLAAQLEDERTVEVVQTPRDRAESTRFRSCCEWLMTAWQLAVWGELKQDIRGIR